jgi:hypothetical protein
MRYYFIHLIAYNTMEKTEFKMDIVLMRLVIFKVFVLHSSDVTADVNHLHIKIIYY